MNPWRPAWSRSPGLLEHDIDTLRALHAQRIAAYSREVSDSVLAERLRAASDAITKAETLLEPAPAETLARVEELVSTGAAADSGRIRRELLAARQHRAQMASAATSAGERLKFAEKGIDALEPHQPVGIPVGDLDDLERGYVAERADRQSEIGTASNRAGLLRARIEETGRRSRGSGVRYHG